VKSQRWDVLRGETVAAPALAEHLQNNFLKNKRKELPPKKNRTEAQVFKRVKPSRLQGSELFREAAKPKL